MRYMAARGFASLGEPLASILIGVIAIVVIAWISVLVTVLKMVFRSRMDTGMKVVWVVLVMSSQPLGVVLWFLVGRHQAERLSD